MCVSPQGAAMQLSSGYATDRKSDVGNESSESFFPPALQKISGRDGAAMVPSCYHFFVLPRRKPQLAIVIIAPAGKRFIGANCAGMIITSGN
jgi:hypothetical protein